MPPTPHITLIFEHLHVYELRKNFHPKFKFVLCLSTTAYNYVREVKNVSFIPLIDERPSGYPDPFRVVVCPRDKGGAVHVPSRMHLAIDAVQSIGKAAFLPTDLGRITDAEAGEVHQKLRSWLGL